MDLSWVIDSRFSRARREEAGERPAIALESDEVLSYRKLRGRRNQYANALRDLGVGRGDRVGLLLGNGTDYVAAFFALARLGAIAVRLNFRLTSDELAFALADSGCSVLLLGEEHVDRVAATRADTAVRIHLVVGSTDPPPDWACRGDLIVEGSMRDPDVERPCAEDPLMLMYTSGTTGRPKAAVWTHANAIGCATSQALQWGYSEATVAMTSGPLYHAGAFEALLLPALLSGGKAICSRSGGFDIERIVNVMARESVTDAMLYPFMIYDLLRIPGLEAGSLPRLKRIVTGGDPIVEWAVEAARELLPGTVIVQSYGLTEATAFTCLSGAELDAHPDAVGRPLPLDEVRVVRDDNSEADVDEVGEVLLRGPGACRSYWQREEETAATFSADGWCRTGDLGRVSADGILFLAGRKKDMIRSGGENISPAEVESVLTSHPAIQDAAVVAVPDERWLEVGCAVVVAAEDAEISDEEIVAHCRQRLAGYKCPKHLVRTDAIPRNASGKVVKATLRERYRHLGTEASPMPVR